MKRILLLSSAIILILGVSIASGLCRYRPGDVNGNGQVNGIDVVYAVAYFKGGHVPPVRCDSCPQPMPFYAAGDVNGSCTFNGLDITFMCGYLGGEEPQLGYCPSCPPDSI
jgi:hypothetical protein